MESIQGSLESSQGSLESSQGSLESIQGSLESSPGNQECFKEIWKSFMAVSNTVKGIWNPAERIKSREK